MPIFLYTGLPGHGKTLRAIKDAITQSEFKDRTVFYYNITDCRVDGWQQLEDAKLWTDLPDGAVIFIDECQRIFPPRSQGAKVPDHVQMLDTHRHRGFDFIIITQSHKNIDNFVRNLVDTHIHVKRLFGTHKQLIMRWMGVADPASTRDAKRALTSTKSFPKDVFELYKSAEIHTVKRKLPAKLLLFPFFILVILYGFYYAYNVVYNGKLANAEPTEPVTAAINAEMQKNPELYQSNNDMLFNGNTAMSTVLTWEDKRKQFFDDNRPFIEDLEWTKPKYVELQKPVTFPKPKICISKKVKQKKKTVDECACYTQQATRMTQITLSSCLFYVKNGYFDDQKTDVYSGGQYAASGQVRHEPTATASGQPPLSSSPNQPPNFSPTGAQSPLTVPSMPMM